MVEFSVLMFVLYAAGLVLFFMIDLFTNLYSQIDGVENSLTEKQRADMDENSEVNGYEIAVIAVMRMFRRCMVVALIPVVIAIALKLLEDYFL
jgi:hypothetical protein